MAFADYNEFIQRELMPDIIDTVIYKSLEPWMRYFVQPELKGGDRITSKYRMAHTSNAAFYDKSDVNPAPATQTLAKPYWDKVFSHGACEVHGIDISNNKPSSDQLDMVADAITMEAKAVADLNVAALWTQIKKDVDSTSVAYSDKSLSRTTYPTLVSYEEDTNAPITLAYARGMISGVTMNKGVNLNDYVCCMENAVYNVLKPLAAALHTWNVNDPAASQGIGMGWRPMVNFEGLDIADQNDFPSMTTGDVLMLRRQDVNLVVHRPLETKAVESGRDSMKFVLNSGINIYVDNPYLNGKMTDKD